MFLCTDRTRSDLLCVLYFCPVDFQIFCTFSVLLTNILTYFSCFQYTPYLFVLTVNILPEYTVFWRILIEFLDDFPRIMYYEYDSSGAEGGPYYQPSVTNFIKRTVTRRMQEKYDFRIVFFPCFVKNIHLRRLRSGL